MALQRHQCLADRIVQKARSIGLQVSYRTKTPGDGACLYHSIIEALEEKALLPAIYRGNVHQLRLRVVDYVYNSWNAVDNVEPPDFIQRWLGQQTLLHQTFQYFQTLSLNQRKYHEYACELFVQGAAKFLQIPILVTSSNSSIQRQFEVFWHTDSQDHSQLALNDTQSYIMIRGESKFEIRTLSVNPTLRGWGGSTL